jgi:hypothetical protein
MQPIKPDKHTGRRLLVAAVGIATVSFVGSIQACAGDDPSEEGSEGALAAEDDPEGLDDSQQALTISSQAATLGTKLIKYGGIPGSGNLMAPGGGNVGGGGGGVITVDPPVGNLMVTPVDDIAVDLSQLQTLQTAGR